MPERKWWVTLRGRGLFEIKVDDGDGFRPASTNEVYWVLRAGETCPVSRPRPSESSRGSTMFGTEAMKDDCRTSGRPVGRPMTRVPPGPVGLDDGGIQADDWIVIACECEEWPGGARRLRPCPTRREPNGRTRWFGVALDPGGDQLWFRVTSEAVGRMQEATPDARGDRLMEALRVWLKPDRQLADGVNRFDVLVAEDGDTRLERLRW